MAFCNVWVVDIEKKAQMSMYLYSVFENARTDWDSLVFSYTGYAGWAATAGIPVKFGTAHGR